MGKKYIDYDELRNILVQRKIVRDTPERRDEIGEIIAVIDNLAEPNEYEDLRNACDEFGKQIAETLAKPFRKFNDDTKAQWIPVTPETMPPMGKIVLTYDNYGHVKDRFLYRFADGTLVFRPDGMIPGKNITHWREMIHPSEGSDGWKTENAEHCVSCGNVLPEGRQVYLRCEKGEEEDV